MARPLITWYHSEAGDMQLKKHDNGINNRKFFTLHVKSGNMQKNYTLGI